MMLDRRLLGLAKGSFRYIVGIVLSQWLVLICNIFIIFSLGNLLVAFIEGTASSGLLTEILIVLLVAIFIRFACSYLSARFEFLASAEIKLKLRETIHQKTLDLGSAYHEKISTSEVLQISTEGVDQLEIYFSKYLPQFFYSLLAPITLFVALSFVHFPSALALLLCVPLIPLSIVIVQRIAKKLLGQYWGIYTDLGSGFLENIQGLTTLKVYQADEIKNTEMNAQAERFRVITMKVLTMQLNSITVMDIIAYGGSAVGIIFVLLGFAKGAVGLSGCFAVILLASEFFIPLRQLGSFFHVAMNGIAASGKIFKLLDLPNPKDGEIEQILTQSTIKFENLTYLYDKERIVLDDVSIELRPGISALVGKSGSGKSTIAALLAGQLTGYTGSIQIDNTPLTDFSRRNLARSITYIGHSSYLFAGTVRENLVMGLDLAPGEEEDEARLWETLELVKLADFLHEQEGLDTRLNEQASNLSGGQRQRLALARALLHESPFYIFDEATSNIDVESENDITSIIWELGKTKTVLFISHRLANVVPADIIYMLDTGKLVEQGTHEELLAKQGSYATMFSQQRELEQITQSKQTWKGVHHA